MSIQKKIQNKQGPVQKPSEALQGAVTKSNYPDISVQIKHDRVYLTGEFFELEFSGNDPIALHFDLVSYLTSLSPRHESIEKGVMKNFVVESSYPLEESQGFAVSFGSVTRAGVIRRGKVVMTFVVSGDDTLVFSEDHIHDILWLRSYTPIRFLKSRYPKIFKLIDTQKGGKCE
jgi:hypothetical protein